MNKWEKSKIRIAFLSTYPPRECGIATYSQTHIKLFDSLYVKNQVKVLAISDQLDKYKYSPRVFYEIDQFDQNSYIEAARFLNESNIEVVCIQHEYGIFGGESGEYLTKFMQVLKKPIVLTLHSVLANHNDHRKKITQNILDLSDQIIVMTNLSKKILVENFAITPEKISIVEHGVPNVRFDEKESTKQLLGLSQNTVLSTFGLINRGKGIETAIEAVAKLKKKFPKIKYLIIGATHPSILREEGESYRRSLMEKVKDLSLEKNVTFINKYLDYDELIYYLLATDIYLSPQKDLLQSASGTISFAIGCGCAVISSKTNYAVEILASGRGQLIEATANDLAEAAERFLQNKDFLKKTQIKAYRYARKMVWPTVSQKYLRIIEDKLIDQSNQKWRSRLPNLEAPPLLDYLELMTDQIGIIQHSRLDKPDYRYGYSIDDQSRALIAVLMYMKKFGPSLSLKKLMKVYLKFFEKAVDEVGVVHNYLDSEGNIADEGAPETPPTRAFWALATASKSKFLSVSEKRKIRDLLEAYRKQINPTYLKPAAYFLLGLCELKDKRAASLLADRILKSYELCCSRAKDNWMWYEDELTWGNAILPLAILSVYKLTKNKKYLNNVLQALTFLEESSSRDGVPVPIGQNGWFVRGKQKSDFDQQPLEAADMIILYNLLFSISKDSKYREKAQQWMGWYYGNNLNQEILYNFETNGIYDGLKKKDINLNQGAESIVTYLMAYLSF